MLDYDLSVGGIVVVLLLLLLLLLLLQGHLKNVGGPGLFSDATPNCREIFCEMTKTELRKFILKKRKLTSFKESMGPLEKGPRLKSHQTLC